MLLTQHGSTSHSSSTGSTHQEVLPCSSLCHLADCSHFHVHIKALSFVRMCMQAAAQQQQQQQHQQYQQQLQQMTLSRLSPQQMQQLHALPVEQRAMQFGRYMRETQLQLHQHQMHSQQQVRCPSSDGVYCCFFAADGPWRVCITRSC